MRTLWHLHPFTLMATLPSLGTECEPEGHHGAAWIVALPGLHVGHMGRLNAAVTKLSASTMDIVRSVMEYAASFTPPLTTPLSISMALWQPDDEYDDADTGFEMRFCTADPCPEHRLTVIVSETDSTVWVCLDEEPAWEGPFASALDVIRPYLQEVAGDVNNVK